MSQTSAEAACSARPAIAAPVSPLMLSDRLISLAEQAGEAGCNATARDLLRLASRVLDERRPAQRRFRPS